MAAGNGFLQLRAAVAQPILHSVPRYEFAAASARRPSRSTAHERVGDPASCPDGHADTVRLLSTVAVGGRSNAPAGAVLRRRLLRRLTPRLVTGVNTSDGYGAVHHRYRRSPISGPPERPGSRLIPMRAPPDRGEPSHEQHSGHRREPEAGESIVSENGKYKAELRPTATSSSAARPPGLGHDD